MEEISYDEVVAKALEAFEKRQEEKELIAAAEKQMVDELTERIREEEKAKLKAEGMTWQESKGAASIRDSRSLSDGKDDNTGMKAFNHYMRTGDVRNPEMRSLEITESDWNQTKALQEGTTTEGGYLVPDDFYARIIEKRDEKTWTRFGDGVQVLQTDRDHVKVPREDTAFAAFSATAEEGAYTTNDPAFGEVDITIYKFTKLTKVSEELLADDQANLMEYFGSGIARAWAATESKYATVGTGSSQPAGIFVDGDTDALTLTTASGASDTAFVAADVHNMIYTLNSGYRADAVWLSDPTTEKAIRAIRDANDWAFPLENVPRALGEGGKWVNQLAGFPYFTDDNIQALDGTTDVCIIALGSPSYCMLVERTGLAMSRNPYLYQANGQVGFFWNVRFGFAVLQELAWVCGVS